MNTTTVLSRVIAAATSETHDFTIAENGSLTIRDLASVTIGDDEHPNEFVRLNLESVRQLRDLLQRPDVVAILEQ